MATTTPAIPIMEDIEHTLVAGRKLLRKFGRTQLLLGTRLEALVEFWPCMMSPDPRSPMRIFIYISARELQKRIEDEMLRITLPEDVVVGFRERGIVAEQMAVRLETLTFALEAKLNDMERKLQIEVRQESTKTKNLFLLTER